MKDECEQGLKFKHRQNERPFNILRAMQEKGSRAVGFCQGFRALMGAATF
jgi:hypothetical protein